MGRKKGSKNKKYILDPEPTKKEMVTEKNIKDKMNILLDFGFKKEEIASLFEDKDFHDLRSLEYFTSSIIRKMFNDDVKAI